MLSFIRSYYLYIYYWFAVKCNKGKGKEGASQPIGFVYMALFYFPMHLLAILWIAEYLDSASVSLFYDVLRGSTVVETYKGTINGGLWILFMVLSVALWYFICRYRIPFNEIPSRLNRYEYLRGFSWWKMFLPLAFCTMIVVFLPNFIK